jgi:UDPglucose 6-dehydrogenase
MRVGVIGYGVVGSATAEVLQRLGHEISISDINCASMDAARSAGHECLDRTAHVGILLICVPETKVADALEYAPDADITVIRSSVPPGTTDCLSEKFGRPLIHMPEFLRESTALWDSLNPPFVLIGCHNEEDGREVGQLFAPLLVPVRLVSPTISETVKLVLNAYLHTLISFWNEVHLISDRFGVSSHVVGKLCSQDARVSAYGASMHGKPAGGRCLPKDLLQLISAAKSKGYVPELLEAVQCVNEKIVRDGHQPLQEQVLVAITKSS